MKVIGICAFFVSAAVASTPAHAEVKFCNNFPQPVFIAIAYQEPDGSWTSQGWLRVNVGACGSFERTRHLSSFYWRAETDWRTDSAGKPVYDIWGKKDRQFAVGTYPFGTFTFAHADRPTPGGRLEGLELLQASGEVVFRFHPNGEISIGFPARGEVATTTTMPAPADACARIVGEWSWGGLAHVVVAANGELFVKDNPAVSPTVAFGHWTCDASSRRYVVSWNNGFTDTLQLSEDGRSLRGTNQLSLPVLATRIGEPSAEPGQPHAIGPEKDARAKDTATAVAEPRAIYAALLKEPVDAEFFVKDSTLAGKYRVTKVAPTNLTPAEEQAQMIGRIVVTLQGPEAENAMGHRVFANYSAAKRAFDTFSVKGLGLSLLFVAQFERKPDPSKGQYRGKCGRFVEGGARGTEEVLCVILDSTLPVIASGSRRFQSPSVPAEFAELVRAGESSYALTFADSGIARLRRLATVPATPPTRAVDPTRRP